MKEVYDDINKLTKDTEHLIAELSQTYTEKLEEIRNYIETHLLEVDEVGEDLMKLVNGDYERLCSHCSKPMNQGYVIENGLEYYCCDDCLHEHYTDEEYNRLYDDGNGDSYWTEW